MFDPIAGDELGKQRLVEPARHFEVDVFDDGRLAQPSELEPGDEPRALYAFG
jgi:hypothetical protein